MCVCVCVCVYVLTQSCPILCDPMDPCQAPLSMEFPRQVYWSGLPFPTPGDLLDPGVELVSLVSPALAGRFFTTVLPGKTPSQKITLSQIWKTEVWNHYHQLKSKYCQDNSPPETVVENMFLDSTSFWWVLAALAMWLYHFSFFLYGQIPPPFLCKSIIFLFCMYKDTCDGI